MIDFFSLQFLIFDTSRDGRISFEEFICELSKITVVKPETEEEKNESTDDAKKPYTDEQIELYSEYFKQCDKDENGVLDKEEFRDMLTILKVPLEHMEAVVRQYFYLYPFCISHFKIKSFIT